MLMKMADSSGAPNTRCQPALLSNFLSEAQDTSPSQPGGGSKTDETQQGTLPANVFFYFRNRKRNGKTERGGI